MKSNSLGLIETWGLVPAIVAADAASKAAMVSLQGYELAKGGLVTIKVIGDVAAVTAAVSAGAAAAEKVGKVVSVHVIPRPDRQLITGFPGDEGPKETVPSPSSPPPPQEVSLAGLPKIIEEGEIHPAPVQSSESRSIGGPGKPEKASPKNRKRTRLRRPDKKTGRK